MDKLEVNHQEQNLWNLVFQKYLNNLAEKTISNEVTASETIKVAAKLAAEAVEHHRTFFNKG